MTPQSKLWALSFQEDKLPLILKQEHDKRRRERKQRQMSSPTGGGCGCAAADEASAVVILPSLVALSAIANASIAAGSSVLTLTLICNEEHATMHGDAVFVHSSNSGDANNADKANPSNNNNNNKNDHQWSVSWKERQYRYFMTLEYHDACGSLHSIMHVPCVSYTTVPHSRIVSRRRETMSTHDTTKSTFSTNNKTQSCALNGCCCCNGKSSLKKRRRTEEEEEEEEADISMIDVDDAIPPSPPPPLTIVVLPTTTTTKAADNKNDDDGDDDDETAAIDKKNSYSSSRAAADDTAAVAAATLSTTRSASQRASVTITISVKNVERCWRTLSAPLCCRRKVAGCCALIVPVGGGDDDDDDDDGHRGQPEKTTTSPSVMSPRLPPHRLEDALPNSLCLNFESPAVTPTATTTTTVSRSALVCIHKDVEFQRWKQRCAAGAPTSTSGVTQREASNTNTTTTAAAALFKPREAQFVRVSLSTVALVHSLSALLLPPPPAATAGTATSTSAAAVSNEEEEEDEPLSSSSSSKLCDGPLRMFVFGSSVVLDLPPSSSEPHHPQRCRREVRLRRLHSTASDCASSSSAAAQRFCEDWWDVDSSMHCNDQPQSSSLMSTPLRLRPAWSNMLVYRLGSKQQFISLTRNAVAAASSSNGGGDHLGGKMLVSVGVAVVQQQQQDGQGASPSAAMAGGIPALCMRVKKSNDTFDNEAAANNNSNNNDSSLFCGRISVADWGEGADPESVLSDCSSSPPRPCRPSSVLLTEPLLIDPQMLLTLVCSSLRSWTTTTTTSPPSPQQQSQREGGGGGYDGKEVALFVAFHPTVPVMQIITVQRSTGISVATTVVGYAS